MYQRLVPIVTRTMDVRVWFLHHELRLCSSTYRLLPFTSDVNLWRQMLLEAWETHFHPGAPVHATLVDRLQRLPGLEGRDIVLWQGQGEGRVVALQAHVNRAESRAIQLQAVSVPCSCTFAEMQECVESSATSPTSQIWFLDSVYSVDSFVALYNGATWTIVDGATAECPDTAVSSHVLMQTHTPLVVATPHQSALQMTEQDLRTMLRKAFRVLMMDPPLIPLGDASGAPARQCRGAKWCARKCDASCAFLLLAFASPAV